MRIPLLGNDTRYLSRAGRREIALAIVLLLGPVFPAWSQAIPEMTERSDTLVQAKCSHIRVILDAGTPPDSVALAQQQLAACEVTGGPYIARGWTSFSGSQANLVQLKRTSRLVRDGRILDTLLAIAGSGATPTNVRIAALDVLVGYADSAAALNPLWPDTSQHLLVTESDLQGRVGSTPLPPGTSTTVLQILNTLTSSETDPAVQAYAARLSAAYMLSANVAAAVSSIDPKGVTLRYVCGNRFRVRNSNASALSVTYDVLGTDSGLREIWLSKRPTGAQYSERFFNAPTKGTVQMFYNGKKIRSTVNTGIVCGT